MRKIIHVDMDCYYAAIEMRDNPSLQGKPLAVGGRKEHRGVVSTCNYQARKYGVHSAMPSAQALRLCPDLVLVPGRMEVYKQVSQQIREIFARYTQLIEPLSLDEAYLDVTDTDICRGSATLIAQEIRQQIFLKTQLTASAGVAPIKFLAKIASDLNKPNGQFVISPHQVASFLETLKLSKIPGVGKVTEMKLANMGLHTCQDVQALSQASLERHLGKFGALLWERARGIDPREVTPNRVRKSVGVEITLDNDIYSLTEAKRVLERLIDELFKRYRQTASDRQIQKQVVKIKFSDFKQTTIEHRADQLTKQLFYDLLTQVMLRTEGRGIRLVGISLGLKNQVNLNENSTEQLQLNF